jgi:O-antigen/teichoic acid export membrane protein
MFTQQAVLFNRYREYFPRVGEALRNSALDTKNNNAMKIFNNAFVSLTGINVLFLLLVLVFLGPISEAMLYQDFPEYIALLAIIVAIDAMSSLPLARLRAQEKAKQFAFVQLASIFTNIILNLILLLVVYNPETDPASTAVLYIFIANLASSLIRPVFLWREFLSLRLEIDQALIQRMWWYAFPIVIAGFAGIINETIDRIITVRVRARRNNLH